MSQVITCDNHLFELRQERQWSYGNINQGATSLSPKSIEESSSTLESIQIDAICFKPLTAKEKKR